MKRKILARAVLLLSAAILTACTANSSSGKTSATTSNQSSASSSEAKANYKVGDTITFENQASYMITSAEWTDERNQFDDTNPERVLKVTYNITNLGDDDITVGMSELSLYVGGSKMETYPNTNTIESISAGRNLEGAIQHFAVNGNGAMELEVLPFADFDSKAAVIKLDIQ